LIAKTKQMSGEQFPAEPRRPAHGADGSHRELHATSLPYRRYGVG
jgi:hypothetical protein